MKKNSTPYYLSLIGGILILIGSFVSWLLTPAYLGNSYGYMGNMMGGYYNMMGGYYGMMGYGMGFSYLPVVGIVAGLIVLYGAYMLTAKPKENKTWGVLILVLSIVSLFSGGGFFIGAIFGILGGVLALSKK